MDDKDWIAGAAKALAIIEAFDEEHARMTPTMVAARAELSRTSQSFNRNYSIPARVPSPAISAQAPPTPVKPRVARC